MSGESTVMPPRKLHDADVVYLYDGSFEGFLCCVFESFAQHEIPFAVWTPQRETATLYPVRDIETDSARAQRVFSALGRKLGRETEYLVSRDFLSGQEDKELLLIRFLHLAFALGPGTVKRLEKHGIHTMGELAYFSTVNQDILYKEFGVDAELLIDHAWGLEPCGMKEIKAYKPSTSSISEGQVLSCPYPYDKARIIVMEMADSLVLQLTDKGLVTDSLTLDVGYDRENCDSGKYRGPVHIDHYGRTVPKGAHGSAKLDNPTNLGSILISATTELFEKIADKTLTVRRITIAANRVIKDEGFFQVDLFTDTTKLEKEKKLQNAMLGLKKKFGKNAVLKGTNYLDGATMRERNQQIGGHKAK